MEYSLDNLNKLTNLKNLTINNLINTLNLSGLEVEDILTEQLNRNNHLENRKIVLKIPANREDLLNEELFIKEISTLFLINIYEIWKFYKITYKFLLKQKYVEYKNYKTYFIKSENLNILNYSIQVKNVQNNFCPIWVEEKLSNRGIKLGTCIENIINLSISEWGQNINIVNDGFNLEKNEEFFEIIRLEKGENYITSEKQNYILNPGTVVIKKDNKIYSVLGIINCKAEENIKNFILDGTFYDINENSLELSDLNTKISLRYLRRMFLEKFRYSFQRLLTLLEIISNCKFSSIKYVSKTNFKNLESYKIIELNKNYFQNFLSILNYDEKIFEKAGLKIVCETKNKLYFRIPKVRKDLQRPIDLIEEYSRFVEYKNFPEFKPIKSLVYSKKVTKNIKFIKQFFLNNHFNEIFCNSIVPENFKKTESVVLSNPLNQELSILRNTLLQNLIEVMERNTRSSNETLKFFEIGRIFEFKNLQLIEKDHLCGIFQSNSNEIDFSNNQLNWFIAKGFIESFLINFQYKELNFEKIEKNEDEYFHPTKSIKIKDRENVIGYFGELHPQRSQNLNIKRKIYIFEFNLKYLDVKKLKNKIILYKEYSKYPIITKDISIKVKNNLNFSELKRYIKENTKNLRGIEFFDLYFEENIENIVNLGLRFTFQSYTSTLTTEFIEDELKKIIKLIEEKFLNSFVNTF
jgi:phenylalanyl-tRNA synthetase beta chain